MANQRPVGGTTSEDRNTEGELGEHGQKSLNITATAVLNSSIIKVKAEMLERAPEYT